MPMFSNSELVQAKKISNGIEQLVIATTLESHWNQNSLSFEDKKDYRDWLETKEDDSESLSESEECWKEYSN